jgi:anti-sigma B factor antagonist
MSGSQLPLSCPALQPHTVSVAGVLDLASIGALERDLSSLIDAGSVRLIVDLSRLRLCDGRAMSGLVQVSRRCAERGGWLRLANPTGIVATAFRIVALGLTVEIYPTVTAAAAGAGDDRIMG